MTEELLDVRGVAKYLNVSTRTVERLIAEGELVPIWIRGQRRFSKETIGAFVRHCPMGRPHLRRKRRRG